MTNDEWWDPRTFNQALRGREGGRGWEGAGGTKQRTVDICALEWTLFCICWDRILIVVNSRAVTDCFLLLLILNLFQWIKFRNVQITNFLTSPACLPWQKWDYFWWRGEATSDFIVWVLINVAKYLLQLLAGQRQTARETSGPRSSLH